MSVFVFAALAALSSAQANIALGKTVSVFDGSVDSGSAALSTLTDGVFRPQGTTWTDGTVFWDSGQAARILIDLGGTFHITQMTAQFDDNDAYLIEYLGTDSAWHTAWDVPNYDIVNGVNVFGMQTRPDPTDDTARYTLPSAITATALRISGVGPDFLYSTSEIQAFGTAVPAPGALLAFGLGSAARLRRRRS